MYPDNNETRNDIQNSSSLPDVSPADTGETIHTPVTESVDSTGIHSTGEPVQSAPIQQSTEVPNETAQPTADTPASTSANTSGASYTYPSGPSEHVYESYNQAPTPPKTPKKQKKAKKQPARISRGALAVFLVCCMLLSGGAGFFGAYFAPPYLSYPADGDSSADGEKPADAADNASSDGRPSVIYQSGTSPTSGMSADGGTSSYYNVANAVKDAVVEITTEFTVNSYFQYVASGAGSGVIFTADGYILTNNHVIADTDNNNKYADAITVRLTNGEEYEATIVGSDEDADIAVLKINASGELPCIVVGDSDKLAVGEEVVAVGNPLGELGGTVTNGIISALDREINVDGTLMNLLQTNAAINPGNSGGGLFNMAGELIGIVNAKSSGSDIEGLGFAIPVNDAIDVAEQLMTVGYVSGKPYIGVTFYDVTNYQQALYYNLNGLGIFVMKLEEGYNDKVFKLRDRVIAVDGKEITDSSDIVTIVKTFKPGDTIPFTVYRSGKLIELDVTCFEYIPQNENSLEFD